MFIPSHMHSLLLSKSNGNFTEVMRGFFCAVHICTSLIDNIVMVKNCGEFNAMSLEDLLWWLDA